MRIFGHPVHVMLIHFPVALWPAHAGLHFASGYLPAGVAAVAGFWLLAVGTAVGWAAALCGASDLIGLSKDGETVRLRLGLKHGLINGVVLLGFTGVSAAEWPRYPNIAHGVGFLGAEVALLILLTAGNYLGAEIGWRKRPQTPG